jgi:hypothetical protein
MYFVPAWFAGQMMLGDGWAGFFSILPVARFVERRRSALSAHTVYMYQIEVRGHNHQRHDPSQE